LDAAARDDRDKGPYFSIRMLKQSNISGKSKFMDEKEIVDCAKADGREIERAPQ